MNYSLPPNVPKAGVGQVDIHRPRRVVPLLSHDADVSLDLLASASLGRPQSSRGGSNLSLDDANRHLPPVGNGTWRHAAFTGGGLANVINCQQQRVIH